MRYLGALCISAIALIPGLGALDAAAQAFPSKPIRMIQPAPAGAPPDVISRIFARAMADALGQTVIVENRPGAGWTLGFAEAAKAAPDGHTIVWAATSALVLGPTLFPNATYDPRTEFAPVGLVAATRLFLVVHPSLPVTTLKEFTDYARAHPGKLNFGSAGVGTHPHVAMEVLRANTGLDLVHVPFKGNHFTTLVAGDVQAVIETPVGFAPFVAAGKARLIAIASKARHRDYPDVPTAAESGVPFEADGWNGVLAPRATPPEVVARLNAAIRTAVNSDALRDAFTKIGTDPASSSPDEFRALISAEFDKWTRAWKASGAKLN